MLRILRALAVNGILWGFITWVSITIFNYFNAPTRAQSLSAGSCSPMPDLGTTSMFGSKTHQGYGNLMITNNRPKPVIAIFSDPKNGQRYQVVSVDRRRETLVRMPSGYYGFTIMSGQTWCNLDKGFLDGKTYTINGGITIKTEFTTQAIVGTDGMPPGFTMQYHTTPTTNKFMKPELNVRRQMNGSYITDGAVNGVKMPFLLDTGASLVALPEHLARQSGVVCTKSAGFSTAAGPMRSCMGVARHLTIGPFTFQNVEVGLISGNQALLGMNVLQQLKMVWNEDTVQMTPRSSGASSAPAFAPVVPWYAPPSVFEKAKSYIAPHAGNLWRVGILLWMAFTFLSVMIETRRSRPNRIRVAPNLSVDNSRGIRPPYLPSTHAPESSSEAATTHCALWQSRSVNTSHRS